MPSVQTPTVVSALGVVHVALPPAHGAPVTTKYDLICQQLLLHVSPLPAVPFNTLQ